DRLDQTGRSMMLRGVLSVGALGAGLYLTHNIVWGCAALALVWLGALLGFDMPHGRRVAARTATARSSWSLIWTALPLGIATTMAALNLNMPRYFIHSGLGEK